MAKALPFGRVAKSGNYMLRFGDDRDIKVFEGEVERESVIKFKPIYEALHQFLIESGYTHPHSGNEQVEDLYWERWTPSGAKEQHIWWRVASTPSPYIRYFIQIDWQTLNITKTEIAYKGKKVAAEKNDLIIRVKAWVQFDIDDRFKDSILWRIKKVFFNRIYVQELEHHKLQLHNFVTEMMRMLKSILQMQHDESTPIRFEPPMGFKDQ